MSDTPIDPLVSRLRGFRAAAVNAGVKDDTLDFSLVVTDRPAPAAAVFTRSGFCTDVAPKIRARAIGDATLVGIAKGAAMLEPDMATLLVYFYTDAAVDSAALDRALREAATDSFNMLTVDTDTSTSDTMAILASGVAGPVDESEFAYALTDLSIELAKLTARQAEGASKLIEVTVTGALTPLLARTVAKTIAASPLVKTAVFGADPNWGRVAMAIGKATTPETLDPGAVTISFGDIVVYEGGAIEQLDLDRLAAASSSIFSCDFKRILDESDFPRTVLDYYAARLYERLRRDQDQLGLSGAP